MKSTLLSKKKKKNIGFWDENKKSNTRDAADGKFETQWTGRKFTSFARVGAPGLT